MANQMGLPGIWEDMSNFLKVDTTVSQDLSPEANSPVVVKFVVTNTAAEQEDRPEIVFEEVRLKVGVPPAWRVETAKDLGGGESFSYEHHCSYDAVMKLQWAIEGRVSPATLLQFRRRATGIVRNQQLPVKAYLGYFDQLKIHQWWEGPLRSLTPPGPDTTLAEMKAKENSVSSVIAGMRNSAQQLQDFLGLVDYGRYREDILHHRDRVQEYLNRADREIGKLIQILRTQQINGFESTRGAVVAKLTTQRDEMDKATVELAVKLGVIKADATAETADKAPPKPVPPPPVELREIDLHTNPNIEQAIPLLDQFIKESYRENVRTIRIIHGKGIGVLRKAVRLHMESHRLIKSVASADKDHGGEGATEAIIKEWSVDG